MHEGTSVSVPASSRRSCSVAGLFSGIGGLELGLGRSGHETRLLCEIDPAARAVLKSKLAPSRNLLVDDVRELDSLRKASLLVAGFPCQDLSQAGRAEGLSGKNSGLIGEVFRLLKENDVPEVLLENVPFMLKLGRGAAIKRILFELEKLGYMWAYRVIDSLAFGLPQRRQRVFIFASRDRDPRTILLGGRNANPDGPPEWDPKRHAAGFYWTEGNRGVGWAVDAFPTIKGGSTIGIPSPPAALLPSGEVITPTIEAAERLQGFVANWTKPAEKVARPSSRWKLVGNAVNVKVAEWIGRRVAEPKKFAAHDARPLGLSEPWPTTAWCTDLRQRWTAGIGTYPTRRQLPSLEEFLRGQVRPLSARALRGFCGRLERSSLRTPAGFQAGLKRALRQLEKNG